MNDICIVGTGAIGKTAALALAHEGWKVTLLSAPQVQAPVVNNNWDVRVYALNHIAHRLLTSLKVWDAFDASRIAPVDTMSICGGPDETHGHITFDAYSAHTNALAWILEDKNINMGLDAALRFAHNITYVEGKATQLDVNDQCATIHLEGGKSIQAKLVIGADGRNSWVRTQSDINVGYRPYNQFGVVTNFACEKPHHGVAYQWFVQELGIIALLPLPDNRVSLVWSAPDMLKQELMQESAAQIADRLAVYASDKLGKLTPLEPELVRAFPLVLMKPSSMIAPRVALIGDAAHVVHPLAGHGMNLGFGDVEALLSVLGSKESAVDCGDERVLRRYKRMRKEDVMLMQMVTDGLERLFATHTQPATFVRTLGLQIFNQLPFLKRALIQQALGKTA